MERLKLLGVIALCATLAPGAAASARGGGHGGGGHGGGGGHFGGGGGFHGGGHFGGGRGFHGGAGHFRAAGGFHGGQFHHAGFRHRYRHAWAYDGGLGLGGAFALGAYSGWPYYGGYDDGYYGDYDSADGSSYCERKYRSYDPASGTYLGYDGKRHPCP
ncbi:BA14K family protein [Bradyrhizobium japonicum]|uniref:BA14K family protein n=1 Tax=Bradyrhizobium japonicum TaxID=375 RepID=UPI001BABEFCE|nr:BA14K family protein [Bradyrhizobium japonicum]MBR0914104.1 BA14K family protein [Bradyrhizobium japonicum]